ncbi:nuclease-related domain-containing protein [Gordonia phthalatica]|uniref:nuclease-related domain-containing protein n=1 Tax=Gordonia phthalatica TaxID=1136941 RepID=UPI0012FF52C5|nr:nuclease-related domain-containing protein [Gordonia phthalatica]
MPNPPADYIHPSGTHVLGHPAVGAWAAYGRAVAETRGILIPQPAPLEKSGRSVLSYVKWAIVAWLVFLVVTIVFAALGGTENPSTQPLMAAMISLLIISFLFVLVVGGVIVGGAYGIAVFTNKHKIGAGGAVGIAGAAYMKRRGIPAAGTDHSPVFRTVGPIIEAARSGNEQQVPDHAKPWLIGAAAEEKVGLMLNALGPGWEVAHDIEIYENENVRANIDHLIFHPTLGLFMVDTKRWSGNTSVANGVFVADFDDGGHRARSVDTLRWEASMLNSPVRGIIVVVVDGTVGVGNGYAFINGPETIVIAVEQNMFGDMLKALNPVNDGITYSSPSEILSWRKHLLLPRM